MKIVLTGYPKTGKSTLGDQLSKRLGWPVFHTDDVIELGVHNDSQRVSDWFDKPGDWIVEGVIAPRAIRKWFDQNPGRSFPADAVVFMRDHVVPWENKGTFVKSIETVWGQVEGKVHVSSKAALLAALGVAS